LPFDSAVNAENHRFSFAPDGTMPIDDGSEHVKSKYFGSGHQTALGMPDYFAGRRVACQEMNRTLPSGLAAIRLFRH
jgi:hypothetical protein